MPCVSYPDSEQPLPFVARGKLPAYNQHKYKLQHPPHGLDALDLLQSTVKLFFPSMYTITKRPLLLDIKSGSFKARKRYKRECFSDESRNIPNSERQNLHFPKTAANKQTIHERNIITNYKSILHAVCLLFL